MSFCPHCGYNLTRDEVIEADGFTLDPRGTVTFEGREARLTRPQVDLLYAMARADGRPVALPALAERMGSEAEDIRNVVSAQLAHTKRRLRAANIPFPVRTVWGRGYRWGLA